MKEELRLTLAHEFKRCEQSFLSFFAAQGAVIGGSADKSVAIASYESYSDFVSHLYEFYVACIESDERFPSTVRGKSVDRIVNDEVRKLLRNRLKSIQAGYASPTENDASHYDVAVPDRFGEDMRTVRNLRNHVKPMRVDFDLADFSKNIISSFSCYTNRPNGFGAHRISLHETGRQLSGSLKLWRVRMPNETLQLTAQSAGALRVPSAAFGRSGGN